MEIQGHAHCGCGRMLKGPVSATSGVNSSSESTMVSAARACPRIGVGDRDARASGGPGGLEPHGSPRSRRTRPAAAVKVRGPQVRIGRRLAVGVSPEATMKRNASRSPARSARFRSRAAAPDAIPKRPLRPSRRTHGRGRGRARPTFDERFEAIAFSAISISISSSLEQQVRVGSERSEHPLIVEAQ